MSVHMLSFMPCQVSKAICRPSLEDQRSLAEAELQQGPRVGATAG